MDGETLQRAEDTSCKGAALAEGDDSPKGSGGGSSTYNDPAGLFQHSWQSVDARGCLPLARNAHSADAVGSNQVFIFGGWDGKTVMNDLHVLEFEGDKVAWRQLTIVDAPSARYSHATAVVGIKLFVHGGYSGGTSLDDLHVLDTQALTWTKWTPNGRLPPSRADHTLNHVDDKLYLFGGCSGSTRVNTIDVLDTAAQVWIQPKISGTVPEARSSHSITVMNSSLILFGGFNGKTNLRDLHIFNTMTSTWTQPEMFDGLPLGLSKHSAILVGDRMFVFGGENETKTSNHIFVSETASFKWFIPQEVAVTPSKRQGHSSFLIGSTRLFVFGGYDGTKYLNDLHFLDVGQLTTDMLTYGSTRNLVCDLRGLLGDPKFSDVTLVVDGHDIPVHRAILVARCDYFRIMFSEPMKESKQKRIEIHGWKYEPCMALLEFLYTGRLCERRTLVICDVMLLADQCLLDQLKTLCENTLKPLVNSENVCSIVKHADKYQAADLKSFCRNYIRQHAEEVSRTEGFESLSSSPALLIDIVRLLSNKRHNQLGIELNTPRNKELP